MNAASSSSKRRDGIVLITVWLLLSVGALAVAKQNRSVPGLYYDEAAFAGLAKDFVVGEKRLHMPGCERPIFFGRPCPTFVQPYLGALKCWMLIPRFALFGSSIAVLRLTTLLWALLALLIFMLAARRALGLRVALISGILLIVDPNYFFLGLLDWGASIGAFLCRCLAFWLALLWWQHRNLLYLFLASLFLGLGVFNKVDFLVFISATSVAAVCVYGRPIWTTLRACLSIVPIVCLGFLLGTGVMILKIGRIVSLTTSPGLDGAARTQRKIAHVSRDVRRLVFLSFDKHRRNLRENVRSASRRSCIPGGSCSPRDHCGRNFRARTKSRPDDRISIG